MFDLKSKESINVVFVVNSHGSGAHVKAHVVKNIKNKIHLIYLTNYTATYHNQLMLTQLATDNFIPFNELLVMFI